jgi:hypothetical protein
MATHECSSCLRKTIQGITTENELPNGFFVLSVTECLAFSGGSHKWAPLNIAPGNYFKSFEFIEPFPSHFSYLYIILL